LTFRILFLLLFGLLFSPGNTASAYSLLTHQAVVDGAWQPAIVPLLQQKYPGITNQQLREAHAYAYGGAIIQDMGYYPLGNKFFTDLTHYARSGDFVNNLISEAKDRNEYAFALGALAHYFSDIHGHSAGTNRSVPLLYPKMEKHFGEVVTYQDNPKAHTRTEFAFDVMQASRREYVPEAYHDHIGFKVARAQLERSFQKTYGLKLSEVYLYLPLAELFFRVSVKAIIPQFVKVGWYSNRNKLAKTAEQAVDAKELAGLQSKDFEHQFANHEEPGASAKIMSVVFEVVPKVGPLSALNFRLPTPEAEKLFVTSFDHSVQTYEQGLFKLRSQPYLRLDAYNLDTGSPTRLEEYSLADDTHRRLVNKIGNDDFKNTTGVLKQYLLQYYEKLPPPPDYRKEKKEHQKIKKNLQKLENHNVKPD
jgi:hypothetical protein